MAPVACALVLGLAAVAVATPPRPAKPNVLHLVADDMRPQLGCYGHDFMKTPHIDNLSATGLLFDFAYTNFAYCAPSRNSFMVRPEAQTWGTKLPCSPPNCRPCVGARDRAVRPPAGPDARAELPVDVPRVPELLRARLRAGRRLGHHAAVLCACAAPQLATVQAGGGHFSPAHCARI